ncbi:MAG: hypothetical protein QOJ91_410 [Sphingomonadales bacterium]|jgi:hypothetical protein|nr:hypothetical protein [Sphingomonadales bacterium]
MSAPRPFCAALILLAAAAPALAGPQPLTAEQAIEIQRDQVRDATGTKPCHRESQSGDIVVCGRRSDPERLPVVPVEGEREHLLPGELPRAQAGYDTCAIACPRGSGVNVVQAVKTGSKILRHILGKDD